jgi:hypothetical protein
MQQLFKKLVHWLQRRSARRLAPSRARPALLSVEALEKRDLPSASPLSFPMPKLEPAKVGSFAPHAEIMKESFGESSKAESGHMSGKRQHDPLTHSSKEIATPEKPVYGYKHRRRYPVLIKHVEGDPSLQPKQDSIPADLKSTAKAKKLDSFTADPTGHAKGKKPDAKSLAHLDEAFKHLAKGGADGTTISLKGELVLPPEGPLPLDTKAVKA